MRHVFLTALAALLNPYQVDAFHGTFSHTITNKRSSRTSWLTKTYMSSVASETPWSYSPPNEISVENPLKVIIAGAGVGGLTLANSLKNCPHVEVTVLEKTSEFKRFGGPIQLASNALEILKNICDKEVYDQVIEKFTFTGNKENGIKDGIRNEWYAKFDLASPAEARAMPYTGVIERPELQEIFLKSLKKGVVSNGDGVVGYDVHPTTGVVKANLSSGKSVEGDVLIGADGIWSNIRATMRDEPVRGDGSGVAYSGYTLFAGELDYNSFDNGKVGYKVYIGPQQYFVITDIGNGRYQWYAFLARPAGSEQLESKPDGTSPYLQNIFTGWSHEIHHILSATKEDEIEQRDLYDRPPSVFKKWSQGNVCLLGDAVHAMMPNLGQGGCQAIEDALVIKEELESAKLRSEVSDKLRTYRDRRLIRSAAVQGLSRFASDIIIRGFDTPCKIVKKDGQLLPEFQNFNYAGIVTKLLQPILPIFFSVQFNFLYEGWRNDFPIDFAASFGLLTVGGLVLLVGAGSVGEAGVGIGLGLDTLFGSESVEAAFAALRELFSTAV
mmetsp:Transcript_5360/g.7899  ORF Transcript_5360/g.7899 Transcript_5360/m.7899 type:complete len:554 (+) Transcript_5360:129-1790(+)